MNRKRFLKAETEIPELNVDGSSPFTRFHPDDDQTTALGSKPRAVPYRGGMVSFRSDVGYRGGVRRVSQHAAPATASSGYPPSLRPNSAILDATGAQEKTYTAVKQNTAPGMDAAFCIRACAQCVELSGSIGSASRRRGRVGRPTEVTEDEREVRPAHLAVLVMSAFSTELAPQSESR